MTRDDIKQLISQAFRELKVERVQGTETVEAMLTHPSGRVVDLGQGTDSELDAARSLLWGKGDGLAIFVTHLIFDELKCIACPLFREEDSLSIESFCEEHQRVILANLDSEPSEAE